MRFANSEFAGLLPNIVKERASPKNSIDYTAENIIGTIIANTTIIMMMEDMIFLCFLLNIAGSSPLSERILYMNFIFNASVLIFSAMIFLYIKRSTRKTGAASQADFWERERAANSTRRQPLDDLDYITIPLDEMPMSLLEDVPKADDYKQIIRSLSELPIVNFTGLSNTELKLRYGAPNIDLLSHYDQNYTLLVRTLQQWAQLLYDAGYIDEARHMLEFSVSTGTDVSGTYRLLCQIYQEQHTPEKIGNLYPIVEMLNSAMQKTIVRILRESDQSAD